MKQQNEHYYRESGRSASGRHRRVDVDFDSVYSLNKGCTALQKKRQSIYDSNGQKYGTIPKCVTSRRRTGAKEKFKLHFLQ